MDENYEKELQDDKISEMIKEVSLSLEEKGYNSINQIVGYLMSGDPGYISSYKDARKKISKYERTRILTVLVKDFLK
jgi:uncharacterized protein (UPF0297 family)